MKKAVMALMVSAILLISLSAVMAAGNGWTGYNRQARIFVGTGMQWCMDKVGNEAWCTSYLGPYANDKITMKWNAEWDRGNDEGWTDPNGYDAWEDNEWNGMFKGGSGSVWHYKIKWDAGCAQDGIPSVGGSAYCIWGQFATIMDQGLDPNYGPGHMWFARGIPNGYGN